MKKIISKSDFKEHLASAHRIPERDFDRIMEEVNSYYDISVNEYIQTRHQQLKSDGSKNEEIYQQILREIEERRFTAPRLTVRQVRRIIYG